jgi:hypothetical protein
MTDACLNCGSPMNPRELICTVCGQNERDDYLTIRQYLKSYPNSNAMQIANATGISVSKILRFIKNGSLSVVDQDFPKRG